MSIEIKNDIKNELLDRREITCTINNATGLNRIHIRESIANQIGVNLSDIHVVSINQSSGLAQITVLLYVYSDSNLAKEHLNDYLFKRSENDQKSGDESDEKENVTEAAPAEDKPAEDKPAEAAPAEDKPAEVTDASASSQSPSEEKPSDSDNSNNTKEDNNAVDN